MCQNIIRISRLRLSAAFWCNAALSRKRPETFRAMTNSDRFNRAITLFDDANRQDPSHTIVDGQEHPNELLYARRMSEWLYKLDPDASEALKLAARSQHLMRWQIPRSRYPMTRAGYHEWRNDLSKFHAREAASLLQQAGYDAPTIERVQSLVKKENLKSDPETQTLEDVI